MKSDEAVPVRAPHNDLATRMDAPARWNTNGNEFLIVFSRPTEITAHTHPPAAEKHRHDTMHTTGPTSQALPNRFSVSCACGFLLLAGSRRACFLFRLLSLFFRFVSTTKATHPNKWKRLQPHRVRSSHWRCIVLAGTQTLQEHRLSGFAPSRKETRTIQECAKRGPVAPPASAEKPSP